MQEQNRNIIFDKKRILKLIDNKILENETAKKIRSVFLYNTFKIAAIFIFLLIISVIIFSDLNSTKIIVNNTNQIKKIKLPDNSIISLNKNTEIEFNNSNLKKFNRKVKITGEAFFEITKQKDKNFVVQTQNYKITVFGTKFNVNTNNNKKSVALVEGEIHLDDFKNNDTKFVLKPGEVVIFNDKKNIYEKQTANTNIYTSWTKNKIEFDNFSLAELAKLIEIRYNKKLIFQNPEIANTKISGSAPTDSIELIIKALEVILKTKITQKDNQLIINQLTL